MLRGGGVGGVVGCLRPLALANHVDATGWGGVGGGRNSAHVDCKQKRMRWWERCYMSGQCVTVCYMERSYLLRQVSCVDMENFTCYSMGYGWS